MKHFYLLLFLVPLVTHTAVKGIQDHLHQALTAQGRQYTNRLVMKKEFADFLREDEFYQTAIKFLAHISAEKVRSILGCPINLTEYWLNIKNKTQAEMFVYPHPHSEVGYGAFTKIDLPIGAFVCEYIGEVKPLTNWQSEYAYNTNIKRPSMVLTNGKIFEYNLGWTERENSENIYIDGGRGGNIATFINHNGQNANCIAFVTYGKDKLPHVCIIARKPIRAGDELTLDYGTQYRLRNGQPLSDLGTHNIFHHLSTNSNPIETSLSEKAST